MRLKADKPVETAKLPDGSRQEPLRDPIAIIGIGCRYSGASGPRELWKNLLAGQESIQPYAEQRFEALDRRYEQVRTEGPRPGGLLTDRGGFLPEIDKFDAQFFEISPREAIYIDPQHRLLLEVAWEALEDAGQTRDRYAGSATGVYTGLWTNEYEAQLYASATANDFYSITGCGRASASGRLSFAFGLEGPSVTVDSACSSSLVAVHMACQALWSDEIEMALAGGANLILGPEISELFTQARMLSPEGSCRFGDASANGFVRSEGAGIVVLKRLSRAIADNDPVYAVIRGGAVNNDGRTSGLLVTPSRAGQRRMLETAWNAAGIDPRNLRYIEMHGTGTAVGDPVEIEAAGQALAAAGVTGPCPLGSIKTNLGHTESAAGVAGLIKAALALRHRRVPASLHFETPNPKIEWEKYPVRVAVEPLDWSHAPGRLLAGVSSFGITGTNAHLVLEEAEQAVAPVPDKGEYLLPVSARTPEAMREQLRNYRDEIESGSSALRDICYTAGARRNHHEYRAAIRGGNRAEMVENLTAAIAGEEREGVAIGQTAAREQKIVFIAPGQGSQWVGMTRELFARNAAFRDVFLACEEAIFAETGWRLTERLLGDECEHALTQIDVIQPALFAVSVALAAVWQSWGVQPDAIIGHSMGEVAAAYIAGVLSLPDAAAVICRRSRWMKTLRGAGAMASVELSLDAVEKLLPQSGAISIAASNGPRTTVISGDAAAIEALLRELEAQEIYCKRIKVDVASHSAQVDPILASLRKDLAGVAPQPAAIPMLSTVTGEFARDANGVGIAMDIEYWVRNLRDSVLFAPAIQQLAENGHHFFIELSPHPILLPATEATARAIEPNAVAVASLRREKPEEATFLENLGALYVAGAKIDWNKLYPDGQCVPLPLYPFQRERCWPEPSDFATKARREHGANLLGERFASSLQPDVFLWESVLDIARDPWLGDHRVLRSAVFPAAGYLDLALSAARSLEPQEKFEVCNAAFLRAAYLPETGGKAFQAALTPDGNGNFTFEIRSEADAGDDPWPLRAKGILERVRSVDRTEEFVSVEQMRRKFAVHRDAEDHYTRTAKSGLQYGPAFQRVQEAWAAPGESLCRLRPPDTATSAAIVSAILDACFQAMAHVRPEGADFPADATYLPVAMDRLRVHHAFANETELFAHARLARANAALGTFSADLRLLDGAGRVLLEVLRMELKRVARQETDASAESLYTVEWVPDPAESSAGTILSRLPQISSQHWILFADATGVAETVRASLEYLGGKCTLVRPGTAFRKTAKDEFEIDPYSLTDLDRLLETSAAEYGIPAAVVHLWSLDQRVEPYDGNRLMQSQTLTSQQVPGVAQAIAAMNWQNPPRVWLVSAGAVAVVQQELPHIENAPLWGIGRALAREHEELRPVLVDLSAIADPVEARLLAHRIVISGKEDRIALRGEKQYVARLRPLPMAEVVQISHPLMAGEQYRLEITATGILDNLELRAFEPASPGPGEIAIEVLEAGLNFIDVMKAMGVYPGLVPGSAVLLGNEAAGRVAAVGDGVTAFRPGDEVIALTPSMRTTTMMASTVIVPAELAILKPARLTNAEAATVAIVYLTAYWSLVEQARLRKDEWVLIHAGAGGVGLAAIEIARWAGAKTIATAGSEDKRNYLRSLGVEHVLDSRSLTFAAGVMEITNGRGVDVVLNSLAGEFLRKSLEVLAPYGRFVEMGKRDIYADKPVGLKVLRNNISFHVVDIAAAVEDRRSYIAELLQIIMRHIDAGDWRPLPVESFSANDPAEPFRAMAQARHIGKLALRMERNVAVLPAHEQKLFSAQASYFITGGLGGVALTVARWMAENGAGHIFLLSRRTLSAENLRTIEGIRQSGMEWGTTVTPLSADITDADSLHRALDKIRSTEWPLKGILHAAAVVDDALVRELSPERFSSVFAPKIHGTWNLHTATLEDPLEFFVLFSSIAAIHPQPGMGSYAAANAFLDAFAQYRRAQGRPAVTINWGGWNQIGLARAAGTGRSIEGYEQQGMPNYSGAAACAALGRVIETNPVQAVAVPFDWAKFAEFHGVKHVPPIFAERVANAAAGEQGSHAAILKELADADTNPARSAALENYLQEALGRVLKLAKQKIDRDRLLGSMGLDSLMGLEFVRRLSQSLEIPVPATVVYNYPTIRQLAAHLLRRMQLEIADTANTGTSTVNVTPAESRSEGTVEDVLALSEEDALQALVGGERRSGG
jgi:acyl transferase domain-containing protein/NADP-dependent 3-hydroxy acid dehydrogenase YdfG/acyl carrier protein